MTILSALAKAYERLPDAPVPGFATQKISILVAFDRDGALVGAHDLRSTGKKREARAMAVPAPAKRTVAILPNALWDKTSYALGATAKASERTLREHAAFAERQRALLADTDDPGLLAFLRFLGGWTADRWPELRLPDDLLDQNVIFGLEDERLDEVYLQDRPAARALLARADGDGADMPVCLVTGLRAPVARLHPSIKGVWGGQSSGGAIVSFNLDAFESYGHSQGDNAPVSEGAAAAYTGALNHFLARDSGHRVQIGDASTVFWADASEADAKAARIAERITFGFLMGARRIDEEREAKEVGIILERIAAGRPFGSVDPKLIDGVRFYILGLSPNAARISVRFWLEDTFGHLAENYRLFGADLLMEFSRLAKRPFPGVWAMTLHTAPARLDRQRKINFDKAAVSDLLAAELTRSALTGAPLPGGLLPTLISRLRTDQVLTQIRISLIKAAIIRNMRLEGRLPKEDYLVRSDPDDPNPARRLGRLFAVIERAQRAALGSEINATVSDKFLASAAATPAQVFPGVLLNAEHHIARLRKGHSDADWIKSAEQARKVGGGVHRDMGRLAGLFHDGFPVEHSSEEQGLFLIGYYQERFGSATEALEDEIEADAESGLEE